MHRAVVQEVLICVISDHIDPVFDCKPGNRADFLGIHHHTRRVRRAIDDHRTRARRDMPYQVGHPQLVVWTEGYMNRHTPHKGNLIGKRGPCGDRDKDLVTRVEEGNHEVVEGLLSTNADADFRSRVVLHPILTMQLVRDRFLEFDDPTRRRVFRLAVADCTIRRFLDVLRSIEVRFTNRQFQDRLPLPSERLGTRTRSDCR